MAGDGGTSAWLVTWEWAGEHARPPHRIAAVLRPQWGAERVRQSLELLYATHAFTPQEQAAIAAGRFSNPYPARFDTAEGVTFQDRIFCGDNPWLEARKVDGLRLMPGDPGEADLTWSERIYDRTAILRDLKAESARE